MNISKSRVLIIVYKSLGDMAFLTSLTSSPSVLSLTHTGYFANLYCLCISILYVWNSVLDTYMACSLMSSNPCSNVTSGATHINLFIMASLPYLELLICNIQPSNILYHLLILFIVCPPHQNEGRNFFLHLFHLLLYSCNV